MELGLWILKDHEDRALARSVLEFALSRTKGRPVVNPRKTRVTRLLGEGEDEFRVGTVEAVPGGACGTFLLRQPCAASFRVESHSAHRDALDAARKLGRLIADEEVLAATGDDLPVQEG